jgi:signal transduction histidine kinase
LRKILETIVDGVVIVDAAGTVRFANPAAEAMFGRRRRGLLGTQFGFPLVAGQTTEVDLVRPRRSAAVAEVRAVAIKWEGQAACLASLRDITERKHAEEERARRLRAEAARAEAEAAVRARDEFLGTLAHELKTPLARLLLTVERLQRFVRGRWPPSPAQAETIVNVLHWEGKHLSRIVSQLFDMTLLQQRALRLSPSRTDLRALVTKAVAEAAAEAPRHQFFAHTPDHPVLAQVDAGKLAQVIANLLDNAVRYSPDGGLVEVALSAEPPAGAAPGAPQSASAAGSAVASSPAGGAAAGADGRSRGDHGDRVVRLTVRDHGLGIPPEHRAHLFERFSQAHRRSYRSGIGLGLYICRGIVDLHGGQIEAQFPDDGGSQFVITLPDGADKER